MKPFFTIGCPEVVPYDIFTTLVDNPQVEVSMDVTYTLYLPDQS